MYLFSRRRIVFVLCFSLLFLLSPLGTASAKAAEASEKVIAITFDDGPSGKFTRRLLDGLAERGVSVTFYLCGYRIEQYPELTKRISEEGHEIGVHGYSHKYMNAMCPQQLDSELSSTLDLIETITGITPKTFRPPGGLVNKEIEKIATAYDLSIVSWNVDPKDWCCCDAATVVSSVVSHTEPMDIILMHDMFDSTVDAALDIIDCLQKDGYRFVTVSELLSLNAQQAATSPS